LNFLIKKGLNTEVFIHKRAVLYILMVRVKIRGNLKRVKMLALKEQRWVGMRNNNVSLFGCDLKLLGIINNNSCLFQNDLNGNAMRIKNQRILQ